MGVGEVVGGRASDGDRIAQDCRGGQGIVLSGDETGILEQGDYVGRPSSSVVQDLGPNICREGIISLAFNETIDHSLHLFAGDHVAQTGSL